MLDYIFATTTLLLLAYIYRTKKPIRKRIRVPTGPNLILQVLVRKSLKMKPGKIAAQVGHGVIGAYSKADEKTIESWKSRGEPIIVLKAEDEEIEDVVMKARKANVMVHKVYDAGRTQVAAGSNTIVTLGPAPKDVLNLITGSLKLMS